MKFRDKPNVIRTELLDEEAQKIAESFVVKNRNNPNKLIEKESLKSAQMRRFFGEFRQLEKKVKTLGFIKVKPLIKMVKSKAHYAANRKTPIPIAFKEFLIRNINAINTKEDFKDFMLHFEAVVGFFYGIKGVRNN